MYQNSGSGARHTPFHGALLRWLLVVMITPTATGAATTWWPPTTDKWSCQGFNLFPAIRASPGSHDPSAEAEPNSVVDEAKCLQLIRTSDGVPQVPLSELRSIGTGSHPISESFMFQAGTGHLREPLHPLPVCDDSPAASERRAPLTVPAVIADHSEVPLLVPHGTMPSSECNFAYYSCTSLCTPSRFI